ncbi:M20/M25/M40 family metallo-hydrolase [Pacificimonas flava]|uniref:Vacuolar membrane protease n=1 Tax=Pacificimonas flava TaxID=1234595 RepID=M2TLK5_9SPHN|nr:M20/M25/M40 family metallo-hydrolase [Pacificimonas flava]EMD82581.1 peptidase M28 [Pacificimonas flava]MBB5281409.1 hypothetical protein [Pacificimonas flava]
MRHWWALAAAIVGAAILAVIGTTPPPAAGVDAPAATFSADRAMVDVRAAGSMPHPTGSAELARVREHLVRRLADMGMSVSLRRGSLGEAGAKRLKEWSGEEAAAPEVVNIVATLSGADPEKPAILLMAHYDTVWGSPGAADDGAGVAAILEVVRAIAAGPRPPRDLMVLLTDAEELSLGGSQAFFQSDPLRTRVGAIINMEARGGGGRTTMFETSPDNGAAMTLFEEAVQRPAASSLSVYVYKRLPNDTDLSSARGGGYTAYNFAFIGRPNLYHSPLATPDALDRGSLQDMGAQVLDLTRALLHADALPERAPDRVFFDVFGLGLISYAPALGWVFVAAAALLLAASVGGRLDPPALLRGVLAIFALGLLTAIALQLGNLLSGADGTTNYYDRLAALPRLEVQAALIALSSFLIVPGPRRLAGSVGRGAGVGAALPLLLLGTAMQAAAPTAAYILVLPMLLAGIASAARRWAGGWTGQAIGAGAAALGCGYMLQFAHQLFQSVGADMPYVLALPLVIGAVLLWPLMPLTPLVRRRASLIIAATLGLAAASLALWVRLDPIAPSAAVYSLGA